MFLEIQDIMTKVFDSIRTQQQSSQERAERIREQRNEVRSNPREPSAESTAPREVPLVSSEEEQSEETRYSEESRLVAPKQKPLDFRGFKLDQFV